MGQLPCLFCQSIAGPFRSREHVFPECLGNRQLVLPKGVVCDRCNNGVLSQLDETLCGFFTVKLQRALRGVRSKSGGPASARFDGVTVASVADGDVRMTIDEGRDGILRETSRTDGVVHLDARFGGGRRMTPRYASELSRSLLALALECAWIDHGPAVLTEPYDHIRQGVLGQSDHRGYVAIAKKSDANMDDVQLTYDFSPGPDGMALGVALLCFGTGFATHSRDAAPRGPLPPDFASVFEF